jgi:NAD-dependent SIR2 family protein deacetylase
MCQAVLAPLTVPCAWCMALLLLQSLPDRFERQRKRDMPECDLLIVMGTSLQVHPFAGLLSEYPCASCSAVLPARVVHPSMRRACSSQVRSVQPTAQLSSA